MTDGVATGVALLPATLSVRGAIHAPVRAVLDAVIDAMPRHPRSTGHDRSPTVAQSVPLVAGIGTDVPDFGTPGLGDIPYRALHQRVAACRFGPIRYTGLPLAVTVSPPASRLNDDRAR